MKKIKAINAPAFTEHLKLLNSLSANPENAIYPFGIWNELNRIEAKLHKITTAECNSAEEDNFNDDKAAKLLKRASELLPSLKTLFINYDCRGFALKIKETEARELRMYQDMGGYGIICPEF